MSLDDLTTSKSAGEDSTPSANHSKTNRSRAWMLPVALLLGFATIFGLLFGNRLIPATKVQTTPVITIRAGEKIEDDTSAKPNPTPSPREQVDEKEGKGVLLFQASGWVEPDPYTIYVPTLTNGVLDEVFVLEGQSVKKGTLLATLIDDDAKLALREAEQNSTALEKRIEAHCSGIPIINAEEEAVKRNINALELQLEESDDYYQRLSKLSKGAVSQQQIVKARLASERQQSILDEARAKLPKLAAQLAQIDAEKLSMEATLTTLATKRDLAKLALDRTKISAPSDGVILRLHAAPGRKKMLNMDDPNSAVIAELYDPEKLQTRIDVPLNEAAGLSVGQIVEMNSDLLPDKIFTGEVSRITGHADLQRNTLQAKVSITNPDPRLRPDMLVRAKFYGKSHQKNAHSENLPLPNSSNRLSLFVSEKALISETQVWVVSADSTAEKRSITLGKEIRDGHRLVLDGLRSGESVILPPFAGLTPGMSIKPTSSNK